MSIVEPARETFKVGDINSIIIITVLADSA